MWNPGAELGVSDGLLLIFGSTFTGSLAAVMMKQIEGVRPLQFQAWVGFVSVFPLILLTLVFETGQETVAVAAGLPFVVAVMFSALVVTSVAHTTYYGLIRRYPATVIAPLIVLSSWPMTVALGILITHDYFDLRMAVGAAIALTGVLVITVRPEVDHRFMRKARERLGL